MGSTERDDPDYGWMLRDVGDQLDSCHDALMNLHGRVRELKKSVADRVERGEGMSAQELAELYVEIGRLFPQRVRKTSESVDAPL